MSSETSSSTRSKKARWKLLVYPSFQLRLLAMNAVFAAAVFSLIAVFVWRSYVRLRELGLSAHLTEGHPYFKVLDLQAHEFYLALGAACLVSFVLFSVGTLYLSNRVAGPIVRMTGFFREVAESADGDIKPLRFRDGDFFQELPPVINEALKKRHRS